MSDIREQLTALDAMRRDRRISLEYEPMLRMLANTLKIDPKVAALGIDLYGTLKSQLEQRVFALTEADVRKAYEDGREQGYREAEIALYGSTAWQSEPPKGEMFIWARPNGRGGLGLGLGYWTVSGRWADAYGGDIREAIRFHPLPAPPKY